MQRTLLKSKIHRATVTDANLQYRGSVTIDPLLMEAADLLEFERVEIYNVTNGERFATYAIPGTPGKGEIVINGAAAHKAGTGDIVILATYAVYEDSESRNHKPSLVYVDEKNQRIPPPVLTPLALVEEELAEVV
ncbi:MAG TPA: aspartate 1-decarboxylase [Thermoanaerobaculia bacterium]|nr:aspartate 1-decarboxylase [Thermoanaerobaculia bacterium]